MNTQIESFLAQASEQKVNRARFLVGPHAGYAYAGKTLAETYSSWDTTGVKRLFILGPSHHVYFRGAQLTPFREYQTPLGNVPVDRLVVDDLHKTGIFEVMTKETDEDEHSFEMHMPFIYKMSEGSISIVPILLGQTNTSFDEGLATVLAPYFENPENAFAISTDFCHWGKRFQYTKYTTTPDVSDIHSLSSSRHPAPSTPIFKSIEYLDRQGMKMASAGSYTKWNEYLDETDNTICGRTPLGILLRTIEIVKANNPDLTASYGQLKWMGYAQSSKVTDWTDSSVSYASAYALC